MGKSTAISICEGVLEETTIKIDENTEILTVKRNESIRDLGVTVSDEIIIQTNDLLTSFRNDMEILVSNMLLRPDQKLTIVNQYIWPKLIYPFQSAPLIKIPKALLDGVDLILRSSVKQIVGLPGDCPNSMLYSSTKVKGLGLFRAKWEAPIQNFSVCQSLKQADNRFVDSLRDPKFEKNVACERLEVTDSIEDIIKRLSNRNSQNKAIRDILREREYESWKGLSLHGIGVEVFKDCPKINKKLYYV
jgi:hypothetical protein